MKTTKSLYSRLALITSVTLVVGYFVVYAAYQTFNSPEYQSGAALSSTFLGKIVSNLDEINGRVTTLEGAIAEASVWSRVGSDINYTAGNVGIGTTTPAASLDVKRTATDTQFAGWIEGADVNNYGLGVNIANTTSAKAIADFKSGNTSRLFVRADGNVGIGTSSPLVKFSVINGIDTNVGYFAGLSSALYLQSELNQFSLYSYTTSGVARPMNLSATAGGTTQVYLNTSGNVGVGTTSPSYKLDVNGGVRFNGDTIIGTTGPALLSNGQIYLNATNGNGYFQGNVGIGTTSPGTKLHIYQSTRNADGLMVQGPTSNADGQQGYIAITLDGDYGNKTGNYSQIRSYSNLYSSWGSDLTFLVTKQDVANTLEEKMRITRSGNVGIGTTAPSQKLEVMGTVLADAHTTHSDIRYKKDTTTLTDSLDKLIKIRGVRFLWRDADKSQNPQFGVIAQEVEKEFPEVVTTSQDGYKSVAYDKLVAPLIEAVKELKKENDSLKQENQDIKSQNRLIEERLDALENK